MSAYVLFEHADEVFALEAFDREAKSLGCTITNQGRAYFVNADPACIRIYLPMGGELTVPVTSEYVIVTSEMLNTPDAYSESLLTGDRRSLRYQNGRRMQPAQHGKAYLRDGTEVMLLNSDGRPIPAYIDEQREQVNYIEEAISHNSLALTITRDKAVARVEIPGNFRSIAVVLGEYRFDAQEEIMVSVKTASPEADALLSYLSHGDFAAVRGFKDWSTQSGDFWTSLVKEIYKLTMPRQKSKKENPDRLAPNDELESPTLSQDDADEAQRQRLYDLYRDLSYYTSPFDAQVLRMWAIRNGELSVPEAEPLSYPLDRAPVYGALSQIYLRMLREADEGSNLERMSEVWKGHVGVLMQGHALTTSMSFMADHTGPAGGILLSTAFDQSLPMPISQASESRQLKYY